MTHATRTVSVVIPAYNYGRFVAEAVESALGQTCPPAEIIVVDDGSTDDTRERLEPYTAHIDYVRQPNSGLSAARNAGMHRARGEWIALLDADDVWHRQKLEVQLAAVSDHSDICLVGSPPATQLPKELRPSPPTRLIGVREFLTRLRMGPSSVLLRRRFLQDVGDFDTRLRSVEDRDMWLRLAARFPCLFVDSPCWWYRHHPGQMNRHSERMFVNYDLVLKKFFVEHPEYRRLRRLAYAHLYFDNAWSCLEEGRRVAALSRLMRSACLSPFGLGDRLPDSPLRRLKVALRAAFGSIPGQPGT
jgi:glycosyltransferase involved in cell wall biosynthesis